MLKTTAIVLVVLIAALLAYAATRPDSFRIQRSIVIQAAPEQIVPFIDDFRSWAAWSPYEKIDPAMQRNFGGAPRGVGATYAWHGQGKAGAGRMEITDAALPSNVKIRLDFTQPFNASNTAEFTLQPQDAATQVTWAMYGPSPFITKLVGVFMNMDTLIGKDFETGLANLKAAAEK